MQVDESDQDISKRQKVTHGKDMELEGLVMESELYRLQVQVKQDADADLDRIVYRWQSERSCEEGFATVRCASICSCGGSVFKSWKGAFRPREQDGT